MIKLFENIENYKKLSLKDMAVVALNYVYFVPVCKAEEYSNKAVPLAKEAHKKDRTFFDTFETEREELSSIIEEYFDQDYFKKQKDALKDNMFDTNYALKGNLNKMNSKQLRDFALIMTWGHACWDLFMTEDKQRDFSYDLSVATDTLFGGNMFDKLDKVPKQKLINIYLDNIDLNIILANNVSENILIGYDLEKLHQYIKYVIDLKYKYLYRATILM